MNKKMYVLGTIPGFTPWFEVEVVLEIFGKMFVDNLTEVLMVFVFVIIGLMEIVFAEAGNWRANSFCKQTVKIILSTAPIA